MPIDRIELYERSGAYVATIPATAATVDGDKNRSSNYMLRFRAGADRLPLLRVRGRRVKAFDGSTCVFNGFVSGPSADISPGDAVVEMTCLDKPSAYAAAKAIEDAVIEDTPTESGPLMSSVSASSVLPSDAILATGIVYNQSIVAFQADGAVWDPDNQRWVYGATTPQGCGVEAYGSVWDGSYRAYADTSNLVTILVTGYSLSITLDMQASITAKSITATSNGSAFVTVSNDGVTFGAFSPATPFRYIHVEAGRSECPITLGLTVVTATPSAAANVLADDSAYWQPNNGDVLRQLTIYRAAAATCNVAYLRLGFNSADRTTRYVGYLDGSTDNVNWTRLASVAGTPSRLVEVPFTSGSWRFVRLTITSCSGPCSVRYFSVENVVATQTVDSVIRALLTAEGETDFDFLITRTPVKKCIRERGESVLDTCKRLAATAGLELWWTKAGVATLRPLEDYDITAVIPTVTAMLHLSASWPDDVINEISGTYDSPDSQLYVVLRDDNASSETSIQRIGRRTDCRTYRAADTLRKLQAALAADLLLATRQTSVARFTAGADLTMELGSLRRLLNVQTGITGVYVVDAYSLAWDPEVGTYDTEAQVRQIA